MSEPCRQESAIVSLQNNDNRLFQTLERIERGQEKFIEILENIAAQGERITALQASLTKQDDAVTTLFDRVRDLEKAPADDAGKVKHSFLNAIIAAVISVFVSLTVIKK